MPNLTRSECLTVTSLLPGSFIIEMCLFDFMTDEPSAKTSYKPSKLFFDRMDMGFFFANFNASEASILGTGRPTSG